MNSRYLLFLAALAALAGVVAADEITSQQFIDTYVTVTGDSDITQPFYGSCGVNFNDSFDVQVIDGNYRPVEGAWVTIRYQYSKTFADKYTLTNPGKTNANGIRHYDVQNYEPYKDKVDCNIAIFTSQDKSINATKVIANNHAKTVTLRLGDLYILTVTARDELGRLLPGVTVKASNETKKTGASGSASFWVTAGSVPYVANYGVAKSAGSVTMTGDTNYEVQFRKHSFAIAMADDDGKPLNGTVLVFGNVYQVPQDGVFFYNETWGDKVPYTAEYMGVNMSGEMDLSKENTTSIVFDIHAPTISSVQYGTFEKRPRLTITITDPGKSASGVDASSLSVIYTTGDAAATSQWSTARVFTSGKNQWMADFPEMQANTLVTFRISAKDVAGNRASLDGKFSTVDPNPPPPPPQNQTNGGQAQPTEQGIPLLYIAGGIVIVIIIVFLVFRLKSEGEGGG